MTVEYMDAYGQWQHLDNATAARVAPGTYEVTLGELPPTWHVRLNLFDGSQLRVNGLETKRVIGIRKERDKVILLATARVSPPPSRVA
jgi:hypothetical protein